MAKRNAKSTAPERAPAAPPAEEIAAAAPADDRYTVGTWKGLPNYECARCPFKTLSEEAMHLHLGGHAQLDAAGKRPQVRGLILDRDGDPITESQEG